MHKGIVPDGFRPSVDAISFDRCLKDFFVLPIDAVYWRLTPPSTASSFLVLEILVLGDWPSLYAFPGELMSKVEEQKTKIDLLEHTPSKVWPKLEEYLSRAA
jgi:hypothetical protein